MDLLTQRLRLREMQASDITALYRFSLHPDLQRFEDSPPLDEHGFRQVILAVIAEQAEFPRSSYYFSILQAPGDQILGSCYVSIRDSEHLQAEIGYVLGPAHWNQGYATEAVQAVLDFGFTTLTMHRIFAEVLAENSASVRVLEKLGMRREARLRHHKYFQDRWWDSCIYALLEDEWRARQG
jgi:RimJ/RimL family protein N-acetyltransferase